MGVDMVWFLMGVTTVFSGVSRPGSQKVLVCDIEGSAINMVGIRAATFSDLQPVLLMVFTCVYPTARQGQPQMAKTWRE